MIQLLGLLLLSFFITSILLVPMIDLLYKLKLRRRFQDTRDAFDKKTPIFDQYHNIKKGVPVGAGALIIIVVSVLSFWACALLGVPIRKLEITLIVFTFISFGVLGGYDDIKKMFPDKSNFFGLRLRHKLIIQLVLSTIIGMVMYFGLGYDFMYIHWLGKIHLGIFFIPLAVFVITGFTNAFNITDGLDGLSSGLLMICLVAFSVISAAILDQTMSIFIFIWIGALIAFLYFNIFPARVLLGDVGALSFGATLGILGLLTGKIFAVIIIGAFFFIEAGTSFLQLFWKKYYHHKLFPVAPFHLWLQKNGWEEPKIVMRAWIAGIILGILGLWFAILA
jgi:phospho-N-acetylmuramoyl-pentapeptide-transferase